MIHKLEIDNNCIILCGDGFIDYFNKAIREEINKEFNKNKYDS